MEGNWREVSATWLGENAFEGKNSAGGSVQIGTFEEKPGVGPMEMLLLGVAGCTGMDIVSILGKQRKVLTDFKVLVRGNRRNEYPMIYTDIDVAYHLWGENLDTQSVERAIRLSEEKYCSASAMMSASAKMRSFYQIYAPEESMGEVFDETREFSHNIQE